MNRKSLFAKMKVHFMAIVIGVGLAGCGTKNLPGIENNPLEYGMNDASEQEDAGGVGRYVGTMVHEGKEFYSLTQAQTLQDGRIVLLNCYAKEKLISEDGGSTWNIERDDTLYDFLEEHDPLAAAVAKDGTIAVISMDEREDSPGGFYSEYDFNLYIYNTDNTVKRISVEMPDADSRLRELVFDDAGTLYAYVSGVGAVYQIDVAADSAKQLVQVENSNESMMACRDGILMCVTAKTLFLYDLEEKCFIEDAVLESFVEENYKGGMLWVGGTYHVYPFLGADRTIYFVGEKGLYRHAIGGGVVEQVIDGAFSPLGSPTEHIVAMIANDNNEFLGMFDNGKLFQYVYDADLPSVPTDRLTVYSLNEDELVKQTIAVCQAEAPNLYIQYQIGMDEEGITREDAIKKLNTQLLAGGGPDIIMLDNMNIDAYAEKGVLKDLSDIVAEVGEQEGLYGSIVENLAMDGRIYTVPGKFYIPVIYGQEAFVNGVEDYASMAKMVAGARKAFPDTDLLNVCSATGILRRSMPVCAPSWTDADGKLNKDNIRLFLEQSRQIYDAQINGTPQAEIEAYEQSRYLQDGTDIEERADFGSIYSSDYLLLQAPFAYGEITAAWDYEDMLSVPKMREAKGMVSKQLNGQSSNVYHPASMIGINAAAEHSEAADQFVKRMLGADVQKLIQLGLPVSQKALWEQFACEESALGEDGEKAYSGFTLANGENFIYSVYPASQADIERLDAWIAQLDTPYLGDMVLENAVCTEGAAYLEGRQTLDAAVAAIVDSVEIYLYE